MDATGTLVRDLEGQKRSLYYCLIASDVNLPVLEFVSTSHTGDTLSYVMKRFLADVRIVNGGRSIQPGHIVTDFSYAIINAVLDAFNHQTLCDYLNYCFSVFQYKQSASSLRSRTFVGLCVSHMIKAVSNRLKSNGKKKCVRKKILVMFAALTTTASVEAAAVMYRNVYTVLCSANLTVAVQSSLTAIEVHIKRIGTSDIDNLTVVDDEEENFTNTIVTGDNNVKIMLKRKSRNVWLEAVTDSKISVRGELWGLTRVRKEQTSFSFLHKIMIALYIVILKVTPNVN